MKKDTQELQILNYLLKNKKIDAMVALKDFGCFRLSARIFDLIGEGFPIDSDRKTTGTNKRVAEYKMNPRSIQYSVMYEYKTKNNLKTIGGNYQDGGQLVPKEV